MQKKSKLEDFIKIYLKNREIANTDTGYRAYLSESGISEEGRLHKGVTDAYVAAQRAPRIENAHSGFEEYLSSQARRAGTERAIGALAGYASAHSRASADHAEGVYAERKEARLLAEREKEREAEERKKAEEAELEAKRRAEEAERLEAERQAEAEAQAKAKEEEERKKAEDAALAAAIKAADKRAEEGRKESEAKKKAAQKAAEEKAKAEAKAEAERIKAETKAKEKAEAERKKAEAAAASAKVKLIEKTRNQLTKAGYTDYDAAYDFAIKSGLPEEDAARVAELSTGQVIVQGRRTVIKAIYEKGLTSYQAERYAQSLGLPEELVKQVGAIAKEVNQDPAAYIGGDPGYLEYLENNLKNNPNYPYQ